MRGWERTYWVVFVANLVTAVGMMSFLPFFPVYLRELGLEGEQRIALWTGVTFGAAPLAAAVMGPFWGSIGDRMGQKAMLLRALLAIALFVGAMGLARTPWQLLALRLGQGVFSGFVPPSIALVSVSAPAGIQGRVTGSLQASLPAGTILGPLVGALIQASWGMRGVFVFVSAAAVFGALLVLFFVREESSVRATLQSFSPTSALSNVVGDLRSVLADPVVRGAVAVLFCVQFGLGATNPQLQLYVEELWDGDPARVEGLTAMLFSAMALMGLISSPLWGRVGDRVGHGRALAWAGFTSGAVLLAHALVSDYGWLLAVRAAVGIAGLGTSVAAFGVAATRVASERRGSAMGAVFSARAFAVSFGAMGGGAMASFFGMRGLFVAAGALVLLGVAARWRQTSDAGA